MFSNLVVMDDTNGGGGGVTGRADSFHRQETGLMSVVLAEGQKSWVAFK